jgi:hypothetical protein
VRRLALGISALAAALAASAALAAPPAPKPPAGALSIEGGKGFVVVRGNGGLLGRVARGSVEVLDLTPADAWRPVVNGSRRTGKFSTKGVNLSFRILGGDYRITIRGEGISISARGDGVVTLLGVPDPLSPDTGIYSTDLEADCQDAPNQCDAIPTTLTRIPFGNPSPSTHS